MTFSYSIFFRSSSSLSFSQSSETIKFQSQTEDSLDWIFEVGSKPLWSQQRTNFNFIDRIRCRAIVVCVAIVCFLLLHRTQKIDLGQVPFLYLLISDGIQINCYRSSVLLTVCVCVRVAVFFVFGNKYFFFSKTISIGLL